MNDADELRLGRYLDGDLSAAERTEFEAWLGASPEGRTYLRELQVLGDVVRAVEEERGANAPDLADLILARVGRDGGAAHTAPEARGLARGSSGVRWLRLAPPLGLALAAAAAVALFLRGPDEQGVRGASSAVAVAVGTPETEPSARGHELAGSSDPETGASIESVDFGAQNGTIFMVAGGADVTPVVWLVDEPEPARDRMAPL